MLLLLGSSLTRLQVRLVCLLSGTGVGGRLLSHIFLGELRYGDDRSNTSNHSLLPYRIWRVYIKELMVS